MKDPGTKPGGSRSFDPGITPGGSIVHKDPGGGRKDPGTGGI
jgi:hypothetical protein